MTGSRTAGRGRVSLRLRCRDCKRTFTYPGSGRPPVRCASCRLARGQLVPTDLLLPAEASALNAARAANRTTPSTVKRRVHVRNVSTKVRRRVLQSAEWQCEIPYCYHPQSRRLRTEDKPGTAWAPTIDHIVPTMLGGSNDESNLRAAHRTCNSAAWQDAVMILIRRHRDEMIDILSQ